MVLFCLYISHWHQFPRSWEISVGHIFTLFSESPAPRRRIPGAWEGVIYSCWIYYWISGCLMKSSPSWPSTQLSPWPVWDGSLPTERSTSLLDATTFSFDSDHFRWEWKTEVFRFVLFVLKCLEHSEPQRGVVYFGPCMHLFFFSLPRFNQVQ